MKLSTLFIITAVVALIFGVAFIVVPNSAMGLYGISLDLGAQFLGRYLGSAFLGFAALAWLTRNAETSQARRAVVVSFFVATVLGLVVALYDKFAGAGNALVWLNVVVYLLLALGFGYFTFMKTT